MEKSIIKEKKVEAIIGLLFILPAVIGVICFLVNLCTEGGKCDLTSLRGQWDSYGEHSSQTLPIYFGLMAIAGVYMLKNSLRYLLYKEEKPKEEKKPDPEESFYR